MADEKGKHTKNKAVFDEEEATKLVVELRSNFASGKTLSHEWRVSQLKSLLKLAIDHELEFVDALSSDISKPELETLVYEVDLSNFNICGKI